MIETSASVLSSSISAKAMAVSILKTSLVVMPQFLPLLVICGAGALFLKAKSEANAWSENLILKNGAN